MWYLRIYNSDKKSNFNSNVNNIIEIIEDDIVFTAVLKRTFTVHNSEISKVRCLHVADYVKNSINLGNLEFYMSVLEATQIESKFPEFLDKGIMGKWKFVKPYKNDTSNSPLIVLLYAYTNADDFFEDAISHQNPSWVSQSYLCL